MVLGYFKKLFGTEEKRDTLDSYQLGICQKKISKGALDTVEILQRDGWQAFIVGGAVRDLIVGKKPKDFDVVTNAKPSEIKKLFKRCRLIGRRFKLVHIYLSNEVIEVSTFRSNSSDHLKKQDEYGRILNDNIFGEQDEDATRRDLTVNALYYDPIKEEIYDYHSGFDDIRNKELKIIGDPSKRFAEDPVRMIRTIRFACKLDFKINRSVAEAIYSQAHLVQNVPKARLTEDIIKLLLSGNSKLGIRLLEKFQLNQHIFLSKVMDSRFENISLKNNDEDFNLAKLALKELDSRVKEEKSVSIGFVLAAFFWILVNRVNLRLKGKFRSESLALHAAVKETLRVCSSELWIQKKHLLSMREIWLMQNRFLKFNGKLPFRLLENERFTLALRFLSLRARNGEISSLIPEWWDLFSKASSRERVSSIEKMKMVYNKSGYAGKRNTKRKR
ncbi:MAG: hypothetical protein CBC42_03615 [Betaproteobacteria bacterium TMED82]|nr:MAG: hypothetical protein CBC42_03615 [Betaproteobacteria bacterium TMED82]